RFSEWPRALAPLDFAAPYGAGSYSKCREIKRARRAFLAVANMHESGQEREVANQFSKFDTEGFERWEYQIGGVSTVVYTIGEGAPVMYWHGGGTWHGFAWAREWKNRFKVILPYHPGFGESGEAPDIGSMDDFVMHYIELCDAMNLSNFALVGTSFGG